jgi:hypothetical protein
MIRGQAIKVSALISGSVGVLCAGNYLAFLPSPAVEILVMLLIIGAVLCLGMAIYLWVGIVSSKKEISLGELETRKSLKKMLIWVWVFGLLLLLSQNVYVQYKSIEEVIFYLKQVYGEHYVEHLESALDRIGHDLGWLCLVFVLSYCFAWIGIKFPKISSILAGLVAGAAAMVIQSLWGIPFGERFSDIMANGNSMILWIGWGLAVFVVVTSSIVLSRTAWFWNDARESTQAR